MLISLNHTDFITARQRIGTCGADESEGAIPDVKWLKSTLKALHAIRHSEGQDKSDYAYHSDTLSKTANHYLGSPLVLDGSGDDNDAQSALLTQVKIATEQDQLTDIKSLYGNAIKLLKHLREPGIIRHVETRREYQLKATQLNYRYIELKEPIFNPHGSMGAAKPWTIAQRLKYAKLPTTGKIRFVPRIGYTPSDPLPRGPNNGYLDKFKNEWDVQLSKLGEKQLGWASRDGKHLNVSLDCKITHK